MAMPLGDLGCAIGLLSEGPLGQGAGVRPESHRPPFAGDSFLFRHKMYDGVFTVGFEFSGIGVGETTDVSGIFHNRHLQPQTNAEKGDFTGPGKFDSLDLPSVPRSPKPPGTRTPSIPSRSPSIPS